MKELCSDEMETTVLYRQTRPGVNRGEKVDGPLDENAETREPRRWILRAPMYEHRNRIPTPRCL